MLRKHFTYSKVQQNRTMQETTQAKQILQLARDTGVLRSRELAVHGLSRTVLRRLVSQGELLQVARGMYILPDAEITEHHSMVEAAKRFPSCVVCLLTALRFHGLTTQAPSEVWLAYKRGKSAPSQTDLPLHVVSFSDASFRYGVEHHTLEEVKVAVTSPAKTVADCFKFRGKVGLDVAIEALRDYRHQQAGTFEELEEASRVCRVSKIIRPYMEMLS